MERRLYPAIAGFSRIIRRHIQMIIAQNINKDVQIKTRTLQVLKDISLRIKEGEFVSVTGRSGSGKTTLLHILSTLAKADSGTLQYGGKDLYQLKEKELNQIRQNDFSVIFQFHHLFPYMTSLENCLIPFMTGFSPVKPEMVTKAQDCLHRVGLKDKMDSLPGNLSGGEQQRVAIARALAQSSKVLFADEPTGSLDKGTGRQIMDLLSSLNQEGLTIVMVTHEPAYAALAGRIIELEDGRIVSS